VKVTLRPDGEGTVVSLAHEQVGTGKKWAEAAEAIRRGGSGAWRTCSRCWRPATTCASPTGRCWASTPNVLTAEAVARLGVPVNKGMLIGNVVEGMAPTPPACRRGMSSPASTRPRCVTGPPSRRSSRHRAGDEVAVTYYAARRR